MQEIDIKDIRAYIGKPVVFKTPNKTFNATIWISMGPTYFISYNNITVGQVYNGEIKPKGAKLYTK